VACAIGVVLAMLVVKGALQGTQLFAGTPPDSPQVIMSALIQPHHPFQNRQWYLSPLQHRGHLHLPPLQHPLQRQHLHPVQAAKLCVGVTKQQRALVARKDTEHHGATEIANG